MDQHKKKEMDQHQRKEIYPKRKDKIVIQDLCIMFQNLLILSQLINHHLEIKLPKKQQKNKLDLKKYIL